MSYEEITKDNRLSFEAREILLRLKDVYSALDLDTNNVDRELSTIKTRIRNNLKAIV